MNSKSPQHRVVGSRRRHRRRMRTGLFLTLSAVVAVTAACGGGGGGGGGGEGDGKRATAAQKRPAKGKLPGIEAMGLTEKQFVEHVEAVESRVAQCMSQAGFEYVPVDVETVRLAMQAVRVLPGYTPEAYHQTWGYGISTRFDNRVKEIGLGPNLATLRSLSPADREAYERTLYGDEPDETFAFAFDEEDFSSTGGCTRKAVEQVFTKEQVRGDYVNPKDVLIDEDPRIVAANERWIQCMKDRGWETKYDYEDQDDIMAELERRFEKLVGDDDPRTLTGPRLEQLKALQREEIAISMADFRCETKHTDPVYRQVETEVIGFPLN